MKITDDMLSAQAAEARELWLQACTPDALPEHRFSRKFRREMRRLVRAQKHSAAFNRSLRLARRTAAVLLLSAAVSFGCAMSVEAYRVSLINTVVRVFNDLTDYRFSSALPSETDSKAFTPPVLSGLPDTMHKTDERSTPIGYTVTYESTTDFLDLTCTRITDTSEAHKLVDTENASVTEFALHGSPVTMIEKTARSRSSGRTMTSSITCTAACPPIPAANSSRICSNSLLILQRIAIAACPAAVL